MGCSTSLGALFWAEKIPGCPPDLSSSILGVSPTIWGEEGMDGEERVWINLKIMRTIIRSYDVSDITQFLALILMICHV